MCLKLLLVIIFVSGCIDHCACPTIRVHVKAPKRHCGDSITKNTESKKIRLDPEAHPDAVAPIDERGKIDDQFKQAVINVHLYCSKIGTNPIAATAAALKINRDTVSKIIGVTNTDTPIEAPRAGPLPVAAPTKIMLPEESPSDAVAPIKEGGKMGQQFRQTVINVHMYLSKVSTNPVQATAAASKVDRHTISKVIKQGATPEKPRQVRPRKAELDDFDLSVIRRIVHDFFRQKEPPTISKILAKVKEELKDRFPYGATMMRKILHRLGFKYGRRLGKSLDLMERSDIVQWRTEYLRQIHGYRQKKRPVVYLDETWFNCNEGPSHVWQDRTVQQNPNQAKHPNSGLTLGLPEASSRGKRLIVVNAIDRSGPVPNSLHVFESKSPVTPEDYHKDMDAPNFERWFQDRLLPNLQPASVIVMDNAPYHSRKENSCQLNLKKAEFVECLKERLFFEFLDGKKIPTDPATATKKRLVELWKEYRSQFEYYAVDKAAENAGHTVLRLPPYHCIFNPIEMLWGYQKDQARKRGGIVRSVNQALETCQAAFREIPRDDLGKYFDHVVVEENKYWTRDGIAALPHPPLIIPVFESGESDVVESDNGDADNEDSDNNEPL